MKELRKMEEKIRAIAGLDENTPTQKKRAELRKKRKNKKK